MSLLEHHEVFNNYKHILKLVFQLLFELPDNKDRSVICQVLQQIMITAETGIVKEKSDKKISISLNSNDITFSPHKVAIQRAPKPVMPVSFPMMTRSSQSSSEPSKLQAANVKSKTSNSQPERSLKELKPISPAQQNNAVSMSQPVKKNLSMSQTKQPISSGSNSTTTKPNTSLNSADEIVPLIKAYFVGCSSLSEAMTVESIDSVDKFAEFAAHQHKLSLCSAGVNMISFYLAYQKSLEILLKSGHSAVKAVEVIEKKLDAVEFNLDNINIWKHRGKKLIKLYTALGFGMDDVSSLPLSKYYKMDSSHLDLIISKFEEWKQEKVEVNGYNVAPKSVNDLRLGKKACVEIVKALVYPGNEDFFILHQGFDQSKADCTRFLKSDNCICLMDISDKWIILKVDGLRQNIEEKLTCVVQVVGAGNEDCDVETMFKKYLLASIKILNLFKPFETALVLSEDSLEFENIETQMSGQCSSIDAFNALQRKTDWHSKWKEVLTRPVKEIDLMAKFHKSLSDHLLPKPVAAKRKKKKRKEEMSEADTPLKAKSSGNIAFKDEVRTVSEELPSKVMTSNNHLFDYPFFGIDTIPVNADDRKRLDDHGWINDSIINFRTKYFYFDREYNLKGTFNTFTYTSFFYGKLVKYCEKVPFPFDRVRKWAKKIDVFSLHSLLIPINENSHWYLAIILNPGCLLKMTKNEIGVVEDTGDVLESETCTIIICDSLPGSKDHAIQSLRDYIYQLAKTVEQSLDEALVMKSIKGFYANVPQQPNYTDCGMYLLETMQRYLEDPDLNSQLLLNHADNIKTWYNVDDIAGKRLEIGKLCDSLHLEFTENLDEINSRKNGPNALASPDSNVEPIGIKDDIADVIIVEPEVKKMTEDKHTESNI